MDHSANIFNQQYKITREDRRIAMGQNSFLIWFTGLSCSGKSTLANHLEIKLFEEGYKTYVLDGDNIRQGLNSDLDFSQPGREENLRRIGEVSKLFIDAGVIVLAAFISPFQKDREKVKLRVGAENFIEIHVNTSLAECERRDEKGLYKKAREGKISDFTGISSPYEPPENPDIVVETEGHSIEDSVQSIRDRIQPMLTVKNL